MQLNFLQSNWLRQYPFRAGHGVVDLNGQQVSQDILASLRITCRPGDLEVYINKIYTNNGSIGISFAGSLGEIGYAGGMVTSSNQNLVIYDYSGGVLGNVTVGNPDSVQPARCFLFNSTNGMIEPSTAMVLPSPSVKSIRVKDVRYTGNVSLISSSTLDISTGSTLNISVIDPYSVVSRGDLTAKLLTCQNSIITGINTVMPDDNGNIDIFAIAPLTVAVETVNGVPQLKFSSDLTMDVNSPAAKNLCLLLNNPPSDAVDTYPALSGVTKPEWKDNTDWPQYKPV